jgi:hypothetical protein
MAVPAKDRRGGDIGRGSELKISYRKNKFLDLETRQNDTIRELRESLLALGYLAYRAPLVNDRFSDRSGFAVRFSVINFGADTALNRLGFGEFPNRRNLVRGGFVGSREARSP